jgi:putative component of membrane protein insertase Oxa1/YidC/SpoIIIJ protein YidD
MRYPLLFLIRMYWLWPKTRRRQCLFRQSCSHFVYDTASKKGFVQGVRALYARFRRCTGSYELVKTDGRFYLHHPVGMFTDEEDISRRLLPPHSYKYIERTSNTINSEAAPGHNHNKIIK